MRRFLIRSTVVGLVGAILIWLSLSLGPAWVNWEPPVFDVSMWTTARRGAWLTAWAIWQMFNYLFCWTDSAF